MFNSYPHHPPGQPEGEQKFHAQMPGGQGQFLENAPSPGTEKRHIPNNYLSKRTRYCQVSRGWGKN